MCLAWTWEISLIVREKGVSLFIETIWSVNSEDESVTLYVQLGRFYPSQVQLCLTQQRLLTL